MPIAAIPPLPPLPAAQPAAGTSGTSATSGAGDDAFNNVVAQAVDSLQTTQSAASSAEASSAAGEGNLADTMIAASKASVETQITTSLLDKAVTSYNDIMNMSF